MRGKITMAMMVLAFASSGVAADESYRKVEQRLTPEQWHATGLDTLSPEQLALLNRLLADDEVKIAATRPAPVASPNPVVAGPGHSPGIEYDDKPIVSRLKGTVEGWEPGTIFVLENGQQWQVVKGSLKLPKPYVAPEVTVIGGFAGRWFLQVDESYPKARVVLIN